ncbi:LolA family protein [Chromohalobacter israelensis]|uniref:LolA family protein n=1 Tax=Chromohalobacter israelensis TaxID=141390 RepID=UPI000D8E40FA|nr:outer membrane lipoprotein carrier protein LolA [Chromohalobacter salexigens]MBZ5875923.1 outer membrane lipoprotein carrier protein LolA [Chromohalobacter salexigens]PWW42477.1 outer membrane lipoprotein-sorting protein [Chromohalobacter salexigens]
MPRRLIACACLLLASVSLSAHAFDRQDLQAQLERTTAIEGRFTQTRFLADVDTELQSRGRFAYVRDKKVVWQLETPVEDTLVLTPANAEDATPGEGAGDAGREQVAALLLRLLGGDWSALEERFTQTLDGTRDAWRVQLTPRDAELAARIAEIRLAGGRHVERLVMETADGDRLRIELSDQAPMSPEAIDALPDAR